LDIGLDRCRRWFDKSINRRIFAAIVSVGGFTILVKLAALAKQLVIASRFGTSDALDAFLIAFLAPSFAINVAAGSFSAALIPTFIEVREREGRDAAQRLFSSVVSMSVFLILAISGILGAFSTTIIGIIGSGFSPEKQALTRSLFFVMLPLLIVSGLAAIWASILNAEERFALAAIVPVMTPVATVVAVVFLGGVWGSYALAVGTIGGGLFEAVLLGKGLKRQGFSLFPRWNGLNPAVRQVARQYAPMAAGALLMSGTDLVDQSMAAMLGPGSVSALNYGNKVVSLIIGIGSLSLSTAIFPHFSRMAAANDWIGIRATVKTYVRLIVLTSVPITLILVYLSDPMVAFLFGRGAFTAEDAHLVGRVQALYLLQAPFYFLGIMGVRLLSALKKNHILMGISALNLITNIVANHVFMQYLGLPGISLSTSLVYFISAILVYLYLRSSFKTGGLYG
jgi:putative peptidoglycan lipid II flippase